MSHKPSIDNAYDVNTIAKLIRSMTRFNNGDGDDELVNTLRFSDWPKFDTTLWARGYVHAGMILVEGDNWSVIALEGTQNLTQALAYSNPGNFVPVITEESQINQTFGIMGRALIENLGGYKYFRSGRKIIIAGYSYGGGAVMATAWYLAKHDVPADVSFVTFGAPRAMRAEPGQRLSRFRIKRFMLPTDPVPFLPPHGDEIKGAIATTARAIVTFNLDYEQFGEGIVVYPGGRIISREYPPETPVWDAQSITEYFQEIKAAAIDSHLFVAYASAIEAFSRQAIRVQSGLVTSPIVLGQQAPVLNLDALAFGETFMGGNMVQIPKTAYPQMVRVLADSYDIRWMGYTIMSGMKSGTAKATIKRMRGMLRRMGAMPVNSITGWGQAMTDFLTAAQAGGQGWNPNPWIVVA